MVKIPKYTPVVVPKLPAFYDKLSRVERMLVREAYIDEQEGLCYYCKSSLRKKPPKKIRAKPLEKHLYPRGFFKNPIHLHHDHGTGFTLGATHAICNAVLFEYHNE